jgi:hypothetical protein
MHQQIRSVPALSPPSVEAFLAVLAEAGVNLLAVGGGDLESGGEIAIAVSHREQQAALDSLQAAGYAAREVDVDHQVISNRAGALHAFIAKVAAENERKGFVIKDITVGLPDPDVEAEGDAGSGDDGDLAAPRVLVQAYSVPA